MVCVYVGGGSVGGMVVYIIVELKEASGPCKNHFAPIVTAMTLKWCCKRKWAIGTYFFL